jgi:hypothetical protein
MRTLVFFAVAASAACTVMVNGKARRIGGGGDGASATAPSDGTTGVPGKVGGASSSAPIPETMAAGDTVVIEPGFVGPLVSKYVEVRFEDVRVYDAGYRECDGGGGAFTTAQAPLAFELREPMAELRLRLEGKGGYSAGVGGVIIKPDGSYVCDDDQSEVFGTGWPKGTYKVLLYAGSIGGGAMLRFDVPSRVKAAIDETKAKLPTIAIGAEGSTNPVWTGIKPTRSAEAADIGMGCDKSKHDRVMPVAKLDIKRASTWMLDVKDADMFLVTPEETCAGIGGERALAAGVYTLWASVGPDGATPKSYTLEADDRERPLVYAAAADSRAVGDLAVPMTIPGKVRAAERQHSRSFSCRGPRQPDFYLTSNQPLQHVEVSILWGRQPQHVHVFGPIERMEKNNLVRCGERGDNDAHAFDVFEGTYAVWVGGEDDAATGSDYHVLVRRTDVPIDPMTVLAPIPKELSLAERALKHHYPYFSGRSLSDWAAAFTTAPEQLFVYPRTAAKDGDDAVAAGEPLLVAWSQEKGETAAYRFDGSSVSIDTRLLVTERPATVALPASFAAPVRDSVEQAVSDSGPEDKKAIDAYYKISERYDSCFVGYMQKNDPTWGHSGELYKISGSGKVTNVSDEIADRGWKKCGGSKVESAANKLIKQLAKTRQARYSAHLAAVRKRFGL